MNPSRASDFTDVSLDMFFDSLRHSSQLQPRPVLLSVDREFMGLEPCKTSTGDNSVVIQLVPTLLKQVSAIGWTTYEYEFEGWLLGDYPERVWVHGELRVNGDEPGSIRDGSIARFDACPDWQIGLGPLFPVADPESFVYPPRDGNRQY